ncbi:hypothetical protein V5799_003562 [Amblyomma americanum]|uniref:Uncharacterized protein n=1 Tax=Amblyomma americanum TaxID=6943 RepID=A0AAQ4D8L2_AMBAM
MHVSGDAEPFYSSLLACRLIHGLFALPFSTRHWICLDALRIHRLWLCLSRSTRHSDQFGRSKNSRTLALPFSIHTSLGSVWTLEEFPFRNHRSGHTSAIPCCQQGGYFGAIPASCINLPLLSQITVRRPDAARCGAYTAQENRHKRKRAGRPR